MQGEIVIVRAFRGQPLIRRVWDADDHAVYISAEAEFQRMAAGKEACQPVGFPREDVFDYDPTLALLIERGYNEGDWDWGKLRQWTG